MSVTLNQKDLADITRKLDRLDDARVFRKPMNQSVQHLQRKLAKQPPKAVGAFSAWADKHPAARRAFWRLVGRGDITMIASGYRRSGHLKQGWTTEVQQGGRRGVVGTIVPYAVYAQSEARQTSFHAATGYPTVEKVAEEEADEVVGYFKKAYDRELRK